ncbi:hypothetical protein ACFOSC_02465 [Streptantibioticus rubrisoli]|uniref:DUF7848 domain-containing protein n=1 Tax=Streptantibioticus rubrisoli TaxID=1387313 RepID=A0ABT1PL06_9ACTN|nr:hypothetical protein [Streptantibioticus rubrisoli]MCQ4046042.1 hypothetical protein [Streptantibioticus rubrisoli]
MSVSGQGAVKSRVRFAQWVLSTETASGPPIHGAECAECGEVSDGADDWDGPQMWCLQHAGRTGHTLFRGTVTGYFRASMQEVL